MATLCDNVGMSGARAFVSTSLDQLLQAVLGRGQILAPEHVNGGMKWTEIDMPSFGLFQACARSEQTQKARTMYLHALLSRHYSAHKYRS